MHLKRFIYTVTSISKKSVDKTCLIKVKIQSNYKFYLIYIFQGEFVGGCDILLEMHKSGDLVEELEKIGITSKLAEEKKWILSFIVLAGIQSQLQSYKLI